MIALNTINCYEVKEGLKRLDDKSVDCIITSPPYWKGFGYEAYFNSYRQYLNWCREWLVNGNKIQQPQTICYSNLYSNGIKEVYNAACKGYGRLLRPVRHNSLE